MSSTINPPVSCGECQRRKQKCNRLFPCNHCLKRGVAHLCRFVSKAPISKVNKSDLATDGQSRSSKKRNLDSSDEDGESSEAPYHDAEQSSIDVSDALNALGYMPHTYHLVLGGSGNGPKVVKDLVEMNGPAQSEEHRAAMAAVPPKPYTGESSIVATGHNREHVLTNMADCLVDNWLGGANYHYYALYPAEFRTQYDGWWATPHNRVTPELTSLILRVCACSALYIIDDNVKDRLETELKADALTLARRMHTEAEKLSASIPPGKGGLVQVQQLFLTAFYFKSAEKWTEAWHSLGAAIREANEIGLHQDTLSEGMSEFDREMRRRLWGILYMWDFALGSMLSRPLLVNHADCTFEMPTLALETDPGQPYQPSPFRHMNLHCRMCLDLAAELANRSNNDEDGTQLASRLRDVVVKWFRSLPAEYALRNADTHWDDEHHWVVFQRRYLHLVGYMSLFGPLKPFVTRNSVKPMTELETTLRAAGVQAALDLMDISWSFFENLASVGAKFHYAVFCIFDTVTVLCSAFVHDEARNLPQRETVLEAIDKGVNMLEELRSASKTTADLWRILKGLLATLPLSVKEMGLVGKSKRIRSNKSTSPGSTIPTSGSSSGSSLARHVLSEGFLTTANSSVASQGDRSLDELSAQGSSASVVLNPGGSQSHSRLAAAHGLDAPNDPALLSELSFNTPPIAPPISNGLMAPNDFIPSSNSFVPHEALFYADSQPSALDTVPLSQADWQPSFGEMSNLNVPSGHPNQLTSDGSMPTVLEYWDWQGLDLGHPGFWNDPSHPHPM
ncbi:hypothetical protein B0H63DRAFT_517631 [Podospora didyma]|uniref:Zn(2)-C6 fungal-type domain-containing protein n=1 Tax=Podospora didyma TaxID=330526 RepID=A0AAE0U841_9PEZI|nr:hypothetical protein B0H63DRAFT_517631 [Podospora didyma]